MLSHVRLIYVMLFYRTQFRNLSKR